MGTCFYSKQAENQAPEPQPKQDNNCHGLIPVMSQEPSQEPGINRSASILTDDQQFSHQSSDRTVYKKHDDDDDDDDDDDEDQLKVEEDGNFPRQSSIRQTLPYSGENPPTFQPGNKSLLKTIKSGQTTLTFGRQVFQIESRVGSRTQYDTSSNYNSTKQPMIQPIIQDKKRMSSVLSDSQLTFSKHSKDSKPAHFSLEYYDARQRLSSAAVGQDTS